MGWVFAYLKPLRKRLTIGIGIKVIATLAELMIPMILTYILDNVIGGADGVGSVGGIVGFGLLMGVFAAVAALGNLISNRMASKTTMLFSTRMRKDLFAKTLSLSARKTDAFTIPSLESRITSDTYNVHNFVATIQRMAIRAPILLLGGISITLLMDWRLSLVMIATLPLIFLFVYGLSRRGVPLYKEVQQSVDGMVRVVREDAQGIRVIKALSKVDYENARYDAANTMLCKRETRAGVIMGGVNPIMTLLMNLGIVGVVALSAALVSKGLSTAPTVIAFMQYFTLVSMAMMSISRIFVIYTKSAASASRIAAVLEEEPEMTVVEDDGKGRKEDFIAFENVSFSYLGKKKNLHNISFSLKKGGHLGVIGATGSGKSTFVKLLLREYDADEGVVRIAGKDVRSYEKESLTQKIGVVLQNGFLYADTVLENICFGRELSMEAVEKAARISQAYEFISALEGGYMYEVTTGGTNLSGGQRQRLAIARALAANPEILILDDASSALDYKTDALLRIALAKELPETTVVTVAQRVSAIKDCDLILVLEDGEVIGKGTHEELLRDCAEYREISESQMGGAFVE